MLLVERAHQSTHAVVQRGAHCIVCGQIAGGGARRHVSAKVETRATSEFGPKRRPPRQKQIKRILPVLFEKIDCQASLITRLEPFGSDRRLGPIMKSVTSRSGWHAIPLLEAIEKPLANEACFVSGALQPFGDRRLIHRQARGVASDAAGKRETTGDESRARRAANRTCGVEAIEP